MILCSNFKERNPSDAINVGSQLFSEEYGPFDVKCHIYEALRYLQLLFGPYSSISFCAQKIQRITNKTLL